MWRALTSTAHRRRKLLLGGGGATVSASTSTLTNSSFAGAADETPRTLTYTARDAGGTALVGVSVTFAVDTTALIDAAASIVVAAPSTIADDGVESSTITVTLTDTDGHAVVGWAGASNVLAATGTGNTVTQPAAATNVSGAHTGSLVSTMAAAKTVSATAGGLAITDTAVVTVTGSGSSTLANIEWATATGTSDAAVGDGDNANEFNDFYCGATRANVMEVVLGSGVAGSPTTNILRITQRGSSNCGNAGWTAAVSPIPASTSHYGRVYFRVGANFTMNHGVSYKVTGTIEIVPFKIEADSNGARFGPAPARDGDNVPLGYPYYAWYPGIEGGAGDQEVALDTWYRYEWHIEYVNANDYRIYPRLYNAAGTLLYDADTYYPVNASPATQSLTDYYGAGNVFGTVSTANAREFAVGYEGPGGAPDNGALLYLAGLKFTTGDWVGPI
jgi:hypothetical protein